MKRIENCMLKSGNSKPHVFGVTEERMALLHSHIVDLAKRHRNYGSVLIDAIDVCDTLEEQLLCVAIVENLDTSMHVGFNALSIIKSNPNPAMAIPLSDDSFSRMLEIVSKKDASDTDIVVALRDKCNSIEEFVFGLIMLCQPKINMG